MEQMYIAYVLGIATVILIGMVAGVVRANIMVSKHVKRFDDVYSNMHSMFENTNRELNEFKRDIYEKHLSAIERRIDISVDEVHKRIDDSQRDIHVHVEPEIHKRIDETRSYIDSRFDKLEAKLKITKSTIND
jgi:peptidoglycan hydrolase CwlO-like protein